MLQILASHNIQVCNAGKEKYHSSTQCLQKDANKKKAKRKEIQFQEVFIGGLRHSELEKAIEKEYEMALQDRIMEETKDKKNAVESYVYDMRNKVSSK